MKNLTIFDYRQQYRLHFVNVYCLTPYIVTNNNLSETTLVLIVQREQILHINPIPDRGGCGGGGVGFHPPLYFSYRA